jgi:uncharacterized protein (UPF0262 family)
MADEPDNTRRRGLISVKLDEPSRIRRSAEVEHELAVALYDLMEENDFALVDGDPGPYCLRLAIEDNRLVLDIRDADDAALTAVRLPLLPFRSVVRDYFKICESYYDAIKTASLSRIEAIDMGRRGLHNEGAEKLRERLADKIRVDDDTARRLFTLVCVLHIRG